MHKMLFSGVIFIGFIALIMGGFFANSYSVVGTSDNSAGLGNNDSSYNLVSGTSVAQGISVPTCEWGSDIDVPILGGIIWGSACISSYIGFLFQISFVHTDIAWLAIILGGITVVFIYAGIRLLRGGG